MGLSVLRWLRPFLGGMTGPSEFPANGPAELTDFQRSLDLERIYVKGGLPAYVGASHGNTIRIVSWNIERGHEPPRIEEALAALRPDIVCLQEVDWGNRRTGSVDVLQYLAERSGMLGLYGIEFLELASPHRTARFAGGGATGNAILTRFQPVSSFRIDLPVCLDWSRGAADPRMPRSLRRRIRREPRIGQRFGIAVELVIGTHRLIVCSVHLEDKLGGVKGRWSQYGAAVVAIDARSDASVVAVIAGDLNTFDCRLARLRTHETDATALGRPAAVPEAAWWKTALLPATGYADPFPAAGWTFKIPPFFRAKLDWITTKGGEVRDCGIGPFSSSDHRPIWIDLDLDQHERDGQAGG